MPDYRLRIEAEYEAMQKALSALPERPLATLSKLDLNRSNNKVDFC